MTIVGIGHIQLAMPAGRQDEARGIHAGLLDILEIAKPPELARCGGAWFALRLRDSGVDIVDGERLPGYDRVFTADPFGNRLERLEPLR